MVAFRSSQRCYAHIKSTSSEFFSSSLQLVGVRESSFLIPQISARQQAPINHDILAFRQSENKVRDQKFKKPRAQFTNNVVCVRRRKNKSSSFGPDPKKPLGEILNLLEITLNGQRKCRAVIYECCQYTLILDDKGLSSQVCQSSVWGKHLFSVFVMLQGFARQRH